MVKRVEILEVLEAVSPGLAKKEVLEHTGCFLFTGDYVRTFNDEIACEHPLPSGLSISGGIPAEPLLRLLRSLPDEEVRMEQTDDELCIKAKRRRGGIRLKQVDSFAEVKIPDKWESMPEGLADAVNVAQECVSTDEFLFILTCVHIHPQWVEGGDNYQLVRYPIETGIDESLLLRRGSLDRIKGLEATEWAWTEDWVHFRTGSGGVISYRRYMENYPDFTEIVNVSGETVKLPEEMKRVVERAGIFSADEGTDQVRIELKSDEIRVRGEGSNGWFEERDNVEYGGEPLSFLISPNLITELTCRNNKCEIAKRQLIVKTPKFRYATVIDMGK